MTVAHRVLLGFFAYSLSLGALTDGLAVYIDLSGQWRYIEADNPRFADVDQDDTKWATVGVPMPPERRPDRRYGLQEFPGCAARCQYPWASLLARRWF